MAEWRYIFADLLTDTDFAELEVTGPTFDSRIITPGSFSANIPIPNAAVAAQARSLVPDPDGGTPNTICHVMRGGDIWDSYVIWTATPGLDQSGNMSLGVQGAGLESWFDHRLTSDQTYLDNDQIDIARGLIANAQVGDPSSPWAPISAAMNITPQTGLSGVPEQQIYLLTDMKMVGANLQDLANQVDGFEYRIQSYLETDTGLRVREWRWGYPTLGTSGLHVFESPGDIITFQYPIDLTVGGTALWGQGDSSGTDVTANAAPLIAGPVTADLLFRNGWVWTDYVQQFPGVTDYPTLLSQAQWLASVRSGGVRIATASVRLGDGPTSSVFNPSQLGDTAQLVIKNDYWGLLQGSWRVVGIGMTPQQRSNGSDIASLVFAGIPGDTSGS